VAAETNSGEQFRRPGGVKSRVFKGKNRGETEIFIEGFSWQEINKFGEIFVGIWISFNTYMFWTFVWRFGMTLSAGPKRQRKKNEKKVNVRLLVGLLICCVANWQRGRRFRLGRPGRFLSLPYFTALVFGTPN
jgi:hypothetical protein